MDKGCLLFDSAVRRCLGRFALSDSEEPLKECLETVDDGLLLCGTCPSTETRHWRQELIDVGAYCCNFTSLHGCFDKLTSLLWLQFFLRDDSIQFAFLFFSNERFPYSFWTPILRWLLLIRRRLPKSHDAILTSPALFFMSAIVFSPCLRAFPLPFHWKGFFGVIALYHGTTWCNGSTRFLFLSLFS